MEMEEEHSTKADLEKQKADALKKQISKLSVEQKAPFY